MISPKFNFSKGEQYHLGTWNTIHKVRFLHPSFGIDCIEFYGMNCTYWYIFGLGIDRIFLTYRELENYLSGSYL